MPISAILKDLAGEAGHRTDVTATLGGVAAPAAPGGQEVTRGSKVRDTCSQSTTPP